MANSYVEYTATGTGTNQLGQATFSYTSIDVLNGNDIKAFGEASNGTKTELTISSRDTSAKTITLSSAPSSYAKLRVYRQTTSDALVDFVDGARLTESDLDTAYKQGLFVAQEVSEDAGKIGTTSTTNLSLSGTTTVDNLTASGTVDLSPLVIHAKNNAEQALTGGNYTEIVFNEVTDTKNCFSGNTFTVPTTGFYYVNSTCYVNGTADGLQIIIGGIYKNGTLIDETIQRNGGEIYTQFSWNVTYVGQLTANDAITIKVHTDVATGSARILANNAQFNAFKIV